MNVTASHLSFFDRDGYVIVEGLLDLERDLQPVIEEYGTLANRLAKAYLSEGELSDYEAIGPIPDRLLQLISATDANCFQALDISLPLEQDIESDTPMHCGPAVFGLLRNQRLLDAVEQFIGPEIYSNPVQHIRTKPPEVTIPEEVRGHTLLGKTFWHQDLGVMTPDADGSGVLSVWVPMIDVSEDEGCLVVVPGSHRNGLVTHCRTASFNGIRDEDLGRPLALPMAAGDVLFLNKLTQHASLSNTSSRLRWSFDLRYNAIGEPTGRPWFPGFVARSREDPEAEMSDFAEWAATWGEARAILAGCERPRFNRWDSDDPLCA